MNKDQLREAVLGTAAWKQVGIITESTAAVAEKEVVEEPVCPLCESELDGELSDESLLEHAEQMLGVFEEAEHLISEEEAANEEEEDLLEGLDEEDIQSLVDISREMKSKQD